MFELDNKLWYSKQINSAIDSSMRVHIATNVQTIEELLQYCLHAISALGIYSQI